MRKEKHEQSILFKTFRVFVIVESIIILIYGLISTFFLKNEHDGLFYIIIGAIFPILCFFKELKHLYKVYITSLAIVSIFLFQVYLFFNQKIIPITPLIIYIEISIPFLLAFSLFANRIKINNLYVNFGILFIIFFSIAYISGLSINIYYKPIKWINDCKIEFIKGNRNKINESDIEDYCKCRYEKFSSQYGNISNFPSKKNYSKIDKYEMFECIIEKILKDTLKNNRDTINEYIKKYDEFNSQYSGDPAPARLHRVLSENE